MRTGAGLALICVGAILAFAVTTNTQFFNLHTAGWVMMIIGVIGLIAPRRTYGWLNRRLVRRTRIYPDGRQVDETTVPPYVAFNPGTARIRAGLPQRSWLLTDPIEDEPDTGHGRRPQANGETEVIEDLYEGP
jgi:hypothetical protein